MALRLASKIRCSILPKFTRSFTAKAETAACTLQQQKQNQQKPESGLGESPGSSPKFNVYIKRAAENETAVRQQIDNRELQPSKLPDYYKSENDIQQGTYPMPDVNVHNQSPPLSMQPRRFEASKTYANVTLPLKASKLASPFPSAVKSMTSHTISDQEKAEQMLAEARIPRGTVAEPMIAKNPKGTAEPINVKAAPNRVYKRNYSKRGKTVDKDDEKCKKVGKKKTKCVKMKAPGCKKVKAITCDKKRKPIQCKKVKAPYPSYSEACYEDVLEKPTECKLCPWRPKDNPHFKGTKKKFHTKITNKENVAAKADEDADGYMLDAKKKPCKNPSEKKKDTKKKKKDKKSKKKSNKKSKSKKKKKKSGNKGKKAADWTTAMRRYGQAKEENETEIVINSKMILAKGKKKDKKKKRPCNKFPFDKCKKKKDKKKKKGDKNKCRKKKKPFVKGCLNNDESSWETIEITTQTGQPLQIALAKHSKKKTKKSKKSHKKRKPKTRDECEKKTPTTRECPADLIDAPKRVRRPKKSNKKKWTSARVKPYMAKRKRKVYRAKEKEMKKLGGY